MNSLIIGIGGVFLLFLGYFFYGRIAVKLWGVEPERRTPAFTREDGVDYVPAKNWLVLFGHHFASIAGAGPIIGPVIACAIWGWGPAVLWIILGSIFLGGMHDFSALFLSVRREGKSIGDIAANIISYRTKIIFSIFLWVTLVLVVAVFAAVGGKTLADQPEIVVPTFGLILVAILVGLMIYRWNINHILSTIAGIILLLGLIVVGYHLPVTLAGGAKTWTIILLIYAFVASVLPVNILLQPRDFLATFILFFGLGVGFLGLLITHPVMHAPVYITGRADQGNLWPMLCVIIACGAISGFHSLVAGGTTSKQLPNERYMKRIGYGAMIMEGVLAILTVTAVGAGLYWTGKNVPGHLVYPEIMEKEGWIVAFGKGYGEITRPLFGPLGALIGIIMLKTFVLTTLDSATRITRYMGEELFGEGLKIKILKNRFASTAVIIALASWLALGNWKAIWPVFGAANQLVAALGLLIASVYLLNKKKKAVYTLIPGIFMLLTTIAALIYEALDFFQGGKLLLGSIALLLLVLAAFVVYESWEVIRKKRIRPSA